MTCVDCQERLQKLLDERQPLQCSDGTAQHIFECAPCRQQWLAAQRLLQGLRPAAVEVPAAFAERVVAKFRLRQRRLRQLRWSLGVAASILVVSFGLLLLNATRNDLPRDGDSVVKLEPSKPVQPSLDKQAAPAKPQMDSMRTASAAFGVFAAEVRDEAAQLIPSARGLEKALAAPTAQLPELPMQEMGKSVESGLEPVTSSARRAATLWANLLPLPKEEKKKS